MKKWQRFTRDREAEWSTTGKRKAESTHRRLHAAVYIPKARFNKEL